MLSFVFYLPLLALAATCPEKVDRDLRLFVAHNACSGNTFISQSKAGVVDAVDALNDWVQESGHKMTMSIINLTKRNIDKCANSYELDLPPTEAIRKVKAWKLNLNSYSTGELEALLWWSYFHLNTEMAVIERRIFIAITGEGTMYGHKELVLKEDFAQMCPLSNTPTAKQVSQTVLPKGVGVFVWLFSQWSSWKDQDSKYWEDAITEARISDYKISGHARDKDLPASKDLFLEGICSLVSPTYLASTSTYATFNTLCEVSECLYEIGKEDGYQELVVNPDRFAAKFDNCLSG